ncbi:PQQ-binding-like beta-propeller repeat protein [Halorussus salilacus]|uniref:outer membrane protein assembly factor BamB family protein n=1 Tax=Halorussus salilacus TaxID=2953750 RepID=UPI00209F0FCF|nr:PQQ-binding-like beta-propeller repeat protein [Halorussus salilacus]USZ66923.1 PQQ-binding-like beta-propeller repeat protein [Halorussus salilacus]
MRPFVSRPKTDWSVETGGTTHLRTVVDGELYVAGEQSLSALSASDGTRRWELETRIENPFVTEQMIGESVLSVSDAQSVSVYQRGNTEQKFEISLDGEHSASNPVVRDGRLYIVNGDLSTTSAESGETLWSFDPSLSLTENLLVRSKSVYVGGSEGTVHAVSVADGNERWRVRVPGDDVESSYSRIRPLERLSRDDASSDSRRERMVYLWAQREGVLHAVSESAATAAWSFSFDHDYFSFPGVVSEQGIYAVDGTDVLALSPEDGSERWRFSANEPLRWYFWVSQDTAYVHTEDTLHAIDISDGQRRWHSKIEKETVMTVPEHGVSTTRRDDSPTRVTALSPRTGDVRWAFDNDRTLTSRLVSGGTVYVADQAGTVWSLSHPPSYGTMAKRTARRFGPPLVVSGLLGIGLLFGANQYLRSDDSDVRTIDEFERVETLDYSGPATVEMARDSENEIIMLRRYPDDPEIATVIERWANLDIDGVHPVLDYGFEPVPWVVTPVAETILDFSEHQSVEETTKHIASGAEIVHRAHRRGLVHGHLVGENVLFADGDVKISEWGTYATVTGTERTASDDVYDLAVLAYRLLCGRAPSEDAVAPSKVNEHVTENVDEVLSRALADDPADRYDSALKFADALRWAVRE